MPESARVLTGHSYFKTVDMISISLYTDYMSLYPAVPYPLHTPNILLKICRATVSQETLVMS